MLPLPAQPDGSVSAAAPTFAVMALLTAVQSSGQPEIILLGHA